jgi:hypothetical protein
MGGIEDGSFPLLFSILFSLGPILLLALIVLAVRRGDPDPTGRRPYATYLCLVSFLAVFALLFAGFAVVDSLSSLAFRGDSWSEVSTAELGPRFDPANPENSLPPGFEAFPGSGSDSGSAGSEPIFPPGGPEGFLVDGSDQADDADIRSAVLGGLFALVALLVLLFHAGASRRLAEEDDFAGSPAWRTYQVYIYAACFVALVTAAAAGAVALYGVFRAIAPDVADEFNSNERREGLATLVSSGLLAIGALVIFRSHWRKAGGRLAPPMPVAAGGPDAPFFPPPGPPPAAPPAPDPTPPPPPGSPPDPTPPPPAPDPEPPPLPPPPDPVPLPRQPLALPPPAPLSPSARVRQVLGRWVRGDKGQSS